MEFLEKLGDYINNFTLYIERFLRALFGTSNDRIVRQVGFIREKKGQDHILPGSTLDRINQLESQYEKLSEAELKELAPKFREQLKDGKTLDDILPDAFAAVREAGKRFLRMRHYDVQMVGGYILHKGMIAEMSTGEGKTLVATLPSYLNGLAGSVHVVTVNDYLARRDMEWMGPVHMGLGLTVGAIQSDITPQHRADAYNCDITYGTNNEFGFDYLRDNMKPTRASQVQGPLIYAIVDEIDNILIDEARTPLIISGPAQDDVTRYARAHKVAIQLVRDEDFEVKEKEHTCHLTDAGVRKAENLMGVDSFYTPGNMEWPHLLDNALRAIHLFKKDVEYVIEKGEIVIVDEHTGRKMYGRQWSDGLHQAVEAKEGVKIKESSQTLATVTLQNYFKLYNKLSGMTGTAMTEANEFYKIYKLDVVTVPSNRPSRRKNHPDLIFRTQNEKWNAVVDEVRKVHKTGQPILVGTVSIEKSEVISRKLERFGIPHQVLNAKNHEREAEFISQAGRHGTVTISTNMAGRGTDIILGGNPEYLAWDELSKTYETRLHVPKAVWDETTKRIGDAEKMHEEGLKVRDTGGLYVIGTERHDARRIDLQLRGRAGRQGDPGESRFFTSLEDDLMRIFAGDTVKSLLGSLGMQEGEAIESSTVTWQVEKAQKRREEHHFEQRKHLLDYDEVMDQQRKMVYDYRQQILDGKNCRKLIIDMIQTQINEAVDSFLTSDYRLQTIRSWVSRNYSIALDHGDITGRSREDIESYLRDQANRQAEEVIDEKIDETLPKDDEQSNWNWLSLSRWVNGQYNLNTSDRELQKIGRDDLHNYLVERAHQSIAKYDFDGLDNFLEDNFERQALCAFVRHQFGVELTLDEIIDKEPAAIKGYLQQKMLANYREQEIRFPVTVGMSNFMSRSSAAEGFDRNGLITWARGRFNINDNYEGIADRSRDDIEQWLFDYSKTFIDKGNKIAELPQFLNSQSENLKHKASGILNSVESWADTNLKLHLDLPDDLPITYNDLEREVLKAYDTRYRPEFSHTERSLILSILDSMWKDHLYYMDQLRSSIGLMGYAQKDPKVEYKREGMKAFEQMWARVGQQVTGTIFRVEKEQLDYMGSLWRITSASHAAPTETIPSENEQEYGAGTTTTNSSSNSESSGNVVQPIRNFDKKVGRNDPCPCGSGKKYKKCHGLND
jgi:preprotein translocase subunit SecA